MDIPDRFSFIISVSRASVANRSRKTPRIVKLPSGLSGCITCPHGSTFAVPAGASSRTLCDLHWATLLIARARVQSGAGSPHAGTTGKLIAPGVPMNLFLKYLQLFPPDAHSAHFLRESAGESAVFSGSILERLLQRQCELAHLWLRLSI